jgi:bifunctional DNA-binding transcriptional regulator/antitoxin component of YhaV-PrlF toxin-antitoxin module
MDTSRIGEHFEAIVPEEVRVTLGLQPGDRIDWQVEGGNVRVSKADALDDMFADHLVPTPEGFTAKGGVADLSRLSKEILELLRSEVEKGRRSAPSKRSFDEIVKATLGGDG